jgi:methionine-rich copper-binding protein CopC
MLERTNSPGTIAALLVAAMLATGAAGFHLDLVDSRPREGSVITESPAEIYLLYNETPVLERSAISVQGPNGRVDLDKLEAADSNAILARLIEPIGPGEYTVSWLAHSPDGHAVRGRYGSNVDR